MSVEENLAWSMCQERHAADSAVLSSLSDGNPSTPPVGGLSTTTNGIRVNLPI
jgi:hypothetical protein